MSAQDIITISAAVVALVQLSKWAGLPDRYGPLAVMLLALFGVVLWGIGSPVQFQRTQLFEYFSGWASVSLTAAGVYGFSRASGAALTRMAAPPSTGAGSEPTIKDQP